VAFVTAPALASKECRKCLVVKSASEFGRDKYASDGMRNACLECMRAMLPMVPQPTVAQKQCTKCKVGACQAEGGVCHPSAAGVFIHCGHGCRQAVPSNFFCACVSHFGCVPPLCVAESAMCLALGGRESRMEVSALQCATCRRR
jgi:hypothetical protein